MKLPVRALILGGLLLASPVWSQGKECNKGETIEDCVGRVVFQGIAELRTENVTPKARDDSAKTTANAVTKESQPGASTGTGQASSTFTDLLPWFDVLGLLSDSDASDGTVALDLNFLVQRNRKNLVTHDSQLQWAFNVSPQPFEPLIAALPEDVQADRKKALQGKIDDTADSELQYTFSVVNNRFGRDFGPHYAQLAALIAPVLANADAPADNQLRAEAMARFGAGLVKLRNELTRPTDVAAARAAVRAAAIEAGASVADADAAAAAATTADDEFVDAIAAAVDARVVAGPTADKRFTAEERKKIEDFVNAQRADLAAAIAKHLNSIAGAVRNDNIDALANLVLLQPQLTFSLNRQIRNELVGPEATGIKVTWEKSFIDFNSFLDSPAEGCAKLKTATTSTSLTFDEAEKCLGAVGDYVAKNAEDLENESRWTASLEYKQVDRWQYALPADGIAMDRPKYDRVVASAGFGRALPRSKHVKDRVDFVASFDSNLDSDDNYKSRLVATLTYTRRIGDMDVPFSIVYANKSEFLEGVDKQIGLHVGVKFRGVDKGK